MAVKILMLCKQTLFCRYAAKILEGYYPEKQALVIPGSEGSKLPDGLESINPEYLISFLSPWIISGSLLATAKKAAINFHPGSPNYPGSGCYNFALYEKASTYGATCHHMKQKVDTGKIIMTSSFKVAPYETVQSLKTKAMNHLLLVFEKVIHGIWENDSLPQATEGWLRKPFTRRQFDELRKIDPSTMSKEEILLRIRATDYCQKYEGAYLETGGEKFVHQSSFQDNLV